jgi:phage FluMu gp28-like protein
MVVEGPGATSQEEDNPTTEKKEETGLRPTTERCEFLVDHLDLAEGSGVPDARLEEFQIDMWNDDSTFRHHNKARQISFSWSCAANAVARAVLDARDGIFISINQTESEEKVRYALSVLRALKTKGLPKLKRQSMSEIEFENGARISSYPAKAARGRARADIYLDELAHVRDDRSIYVGTLPVISKGGRIWIGSSPLAASGTFWEIGEQKLKTYPGYTRKVTPWWHIYAFCKNVGQAIRLAGGMTTEERVGVFGRERLVEIFDNVAVEDFQTEYECTYVDEISSFITWEEIKAAQTDDLICPQASCRDSISSEVWDAIKALRREVRLGHVEEVFSCGIDIGRTRNTTEITLIGISGLKVLPMRLCISLDNIKFEGQIEVIKTILTSVPVSLCYVDQTGIGYQISETLMDLFPQVVDGKVFTNASKNVWSTALKVAIQAKKILIPVDRGLAYQIHSIKKIVTSSKLLSYDTTKDEKHHADRYWSLALAVSAAIESSLYDFDVLSSLFNGA